jgi:hypothetical protein
MSDDPVLSGVTIPLPTAPVPCYRCGAPSTRQGLHYNPCKTCQAMLSEVQALYQGPQVEDGKAEA